MKELPEAWVLLPQDAVPPAWAHRATPMTVIVLTQSELDEIRSLGSNDTAPVRTEEVEISRLIAKGLSVPAVAEELHLTERTAYRHVARLRRRWNASTNAELATTLARSGF